jgi:hypothetical protein
MSYLIYRAKSKTSGGVYIGMTSRLFRIRQREHRYSVTSSKKLTCKAFVAALRKYGYDDFVWEVLFEGLSSEEADQIERFLIDMHRPRYNITAGGGGTTGVQARPVICIITGKRYVTGIAAARDVGVDTNRIVQLCAKGGSTKSGLRFRYEDADEVTPVARSEADIEAGRRSRIEKLKARRHSPETIERMKVAAKLRGVSAKTREIGDAMKRKALVCNETGTVFRDARDAAMAHGLKRARIYDLIFNGKVSQTAFVSFRHALPHEATMMNAREAV